MKTLQLKKIKVSDLPTVIPQKAKEIALRLFFVALSFVLSSCSGFLGMSPFGVAFCASVKRKYLFFSALGSCIGYIVFQDGVFALRYIACILCITIVSGTLRQIINVESNRFFAPAVAASCTFITGTVLIITNKEDASALLLLLCEALISGASAFFICRALRIKNVFKGSRVLSKTDITYLCFFGFLFLVSFSSFEISGFSFARTLACFTIMMCSLFGGEKLGTTFGTTAGVALSIGSGTGFFTASFAVGGLLGGFFSPLGKIGTAVAFTFSNLATTLLLNGGNTNVTMFIESGISLLIFLLIPKKLLLKIKSFFFTPSFSSVSHVESLRRNIVTRLGLASSAVDEVSKEVRKISSSLRASAPPDMNIVYDHVQRHVCEPCGLCSFCWEHNLNDTMNVFNDISLSVQSDNPLCKENLPPHFAKRCINADKLLNDFGKSYSYCLSKNKAREEFGDMQNALSERFSCVSDVLKDLSEEFKENFSFDDVTAERVSCFLLQKNVPVLNVTCTLDSYEHMSLEIVCGKIREPLRKTELKKALSKICARELSEAEVYEMFGNTVIKYYEKAMYEISVGSSQYAHSKDSVCGDCCEYFSDSKGRQIIVLSDGMGTGKRAAVDGTIASKTLATLVKSGFSFETALKMVNSALLSKSLDESLATLDIVCIDSFTGKAEFYKAGAAPSAVKRGKNATLVERASLPAGILSQVEFSRCKTSLSDGDIVLVMSDGVFGEENEWIINMLLENTSKKASELAKSIADEAVRRRKKSDDITVVAAMLK